MRPGRWTWIGGGLLVVSLLLGAWFLPQAPIRSWRGRGIPLARRLASAGLKPNVVLVTLDTTRADHLPAYGYREVATPHLDLLARQGVVFEQCISTSAFTLPSHASILTGQNPAFHGVRVNGQAALAEAQWTLAEALGQAGYSSGGFVGAFVLDGRWGLKQGFSHYDDNFDLKRYKQLDLAGVQRSGREVMDAALAWMEEQKTAPFFAWIHLYDPHTPYDPPEPYRSRYRSRGMTGLYDGEIAAVDEQVGRLLDWLRAKDLEEKTLLVAVGDHGEGLGEKGEITHGYFVYDYAVRVPLLVRFPFSDLGRRRVAAQVRTTDIFPTVLDTLGIAAPGPVQGHSLLPLVLGEQQETSEYAYSESMATSLQYGWSPLLSLRTPGYKYIDAPRAELFDLRADPQESRNLVSQQPEVAERMRAALLRLTQEWSLGAPEQETANLDQETMTRLAALGYGGVPMAQPPPGRAADPKDKLAVFNAVSLAAEQIFRDEWAQAARGLEQVLVEDPAVPQAKLLLSTCYSKLGRLPDARRQVDDILKQDPGNVHALVTMGNLLAEEGRGEEVIAVCKKALAVDARNTQAHTLIGEVYMRGNNHRQALTALRKAVEVQPKLTRNRLNLAAALLGVGDLTAASEILDDIIRLQPRFPLVHFHRGLLYQEQGRPVLAREEYAKEIEHYPESAPARFNLGNLLCRLGDTGGCAAQMQELIRIQPQGARGYLFLARARLGDSSGLDSARELTEKGLSLAREPELRAFGYFLLADVYSRQGRTREVREALAIAQSNQAEAARRGRRL